MAAFGLARREEGGRCSDLLDQLPVTRLGRGGKPHERGRVSVELSLEQLALLLERLDFESGQTEDIAGMAFWPNARAAMELLECIGYEWTNDLGFDCHESYVVRWTIPEGMAGCVAWLAQHGKSVALLPEELGTAMRGARRRRPRGS